MSNLLILAVIQKISQIMTTFFRGLVIHFDTSRISGNQDIIGLTETLLRCDKNEFESELIQFTQWLTMIEQQNSIKILSISICVKYKGLSMFTNFLC